MASRKFWHILTRKKVFNTTSINETPLKRCLKTWDLTALGVGGTLGIGMYILIANVARDLAGPSVVLSFFLAAIIAVFAGLCYAELGVRVPCAGSAYIYSYVSFGEFISFIIGWNLILEYIIGSAIIVRSLSLYVDAMFNNTMTAAFMDVAPINAPILSPYFDFFAFAITLIFGTALAFGIRELSFVNSLFTCFNLLITLFVILAGSITANTDNWFISETDIPSEYNAGTGGFFPFGFSGTLQGVAICFRGFVGFDAIATTGEEVNSPRRAIPVAIISSLVITSLAYFGISIVITMMVPYYMQDIRSPIPNAFVHVGWDWAWWLVSVGAIFGLCGSMFGAMFPLPRVIYAMATDGIIFRVLGHVNEQLKSPVVATLTATFFIAFTGALLELKHLVGMISIGTLIAYTMMAACVVVLRYEPGSEYKLNQLQKSSDPLDTGPQVSLKLFCMQFVGQLSAIPTTLSFNIVIGSIVVFCCSSLLIGLSVIHLGDQGIIPVVCFSVVGALMVLVIALQPSSPQTLKFQVPLVPLLPCISMFATLYLMLMLDVLAWIRLGIWMIIGIPIYLICLCLHEHVSVMKCKHPVNQSMDGVTDVVDIYKPEKNNPVSRVLAASQKEITLNMTIIRHDTNSEMRQINPDDDDYIGLEADLGKKEDTGVNTKDGDQKEEMEKQSNIIKYLDQVIENEEIALKTHSHSSYPEDISSEKISHLDLPPTSKESCNNVVNIEPVSDVSSKCNVVALVHREDHIKSPYGMLSPKKYYSSEETILAADTVLRDENISINDDYKFMIDTTKDIKRIENVNSCVNLEMETNTKQFNINDSNFENDTAIQLSTGKDKSEYFIPNPPPMNEALLLNNNNNLSVLKRANTIAFISRIPSVNEEKMIDENDKEYFIPEPPPCKLDLLSHNGSISQFKRANTISLTSSKLLDVASDNSSTTELENDGHKSFLLKLNNILQNKVDEGLNVRPQDAVILGDIQNKEKSLPIEQKNVMSDLHKELRDKTKLIAAGKDAVLQSTNNKIVDDENSKEQEIDISEPMSRKELKSKLEILFAGGNPQMLKPRLREFNSSTTESESPEEVNKNLVEITKNDTLKLQKERFSSVLDSFKIALNKENENLAMTDESSPSQYPEK